MATVLEKTADTAGNDADAPVLTDLIAYLRARDYRFVTPTPATHARVLARTGDRTAADLRDAFGWSLPFHDTLLDPALLRRLVAAGILVETPAGFRSRVRVSSLGPDLLLHSAYPTDDKDAVFFGPDSYRFAALIARELAHCPQRPGARLVDIGTGTGAGAITAARLCRSISEIVLTDINPAALRLARINSAAAGIPVTLHQTATLSPIAGELDLVLANPPYIIDDAGRAYRDGGGLHGAQVSLEMARMALPRLAPGGRFLLYTGSAIVGGADALHDSLVALADAEGCTLRYGEIDPDVFGEELETEAYRDVERIALVAAVIQRPGDAA